MCAISNIIIKQVPSLAVLVLRRELTPCFTNTAIQSIHLFYKENTEACEFTGMAP